MALPLSSIRARFGGTPRGSSGRPSHLRPQPPPVFLAQMGEEESVVAATQVWEALISSFRNVDVKDLFTFLTEHRTYHAQALLCSQRPWTFGGDLEFIGKHWKIAIQFINAVMDVYVEERRSKGRALGDTTLNRKLSRLLVTDMDSLREAE
ncbi:unnamed protein product [Schistocephalus solidus]|uniref:GLOBIN domain-containing protein n=1 Tax=Schistocephalus solidus TaxID=70667 RepID=A0A183ST07_SCHSO|nr:unnamed protein product [Schistocephalus solidus]